MARTKSFKYLYNMEITLMFGDKSKLVIDNINTIIKHFNYPLNFFPIYECDCVVPIKYTTKIRSNQDQIYAILTITKLKYKSVSNAYSEPEETEVILNHTFIPFFTPDSFSEYVNNEVEMNENGGPLTTTNPASTLTCRLKFAMYSAIGLSSNKKLFNFVADECDVGSMIKLLIDKSDVESCIIDKPDNEDKYKNLIITPHNLRGALRELQTRYGIYANGITEFYDPPTLYVLNKFSLDHDYAKNKPNKIKINCFSGSPGVSAGVSTVDESDNVAAYTISGFPKAVNEDLSMSELMGNEILFSNITLTTNMLQFQDGELKSFDFPTSSIVSDIINHKKSGNKKIVDYDDINNPYNYSAAMKAANLGSMIVMPSIAGIDFDSIKPNTSITISIVDDTTRDNEFSGKYSVIAGSIILQKARPDDETVVCAIEGLTLSRMES